MLDHGRKRKVSKFAARSGGQKRKRAPVHPPRQSRVLASAVENLLASFVQEDGSVTPILPTMAATSALVRCHSAFLHAIAEEIVAVQERQQTQQQANGKKKESASTVASSARRCRVTPEQIQEALCNSDHLDMEDIWNETLQQVQQQQKQKQEENEANNAFDPENDGSTVDVIESKDGSLAKQRRKRKGKSSDKRKKSKQEWSKDELEAQEQLLEQSRQKFLKK